MRHFALTVISCFLLLPASANSIPSLTPAAGTAAADTIPELELPNVPATLRDLRTRANYIVAHFWDALDFRDTRRSRNRAFMEQSFSNFISVFPYAGEQEQRETVGSLLKKAEADSAAYMLLIDIAEKYLYETESPMQSEDYYIFFLENIVTSPILGTQGTIRPRRQLEAARKNRPGMTAADFAYTTRNGRRTTLHKTAVKGELLLMFYDPDCEHCKETMAEMQQNKQLANQIAEGVRTVLAIYSGDDRELWQRTAVSLPENWVVGYESGLMQETGAYVLRTMPTLYLLDRDKKVVQKEVRPEKLFPAENNQ